MRWGPLAVAFLALSAQAQTPGASKSFDDAGVRLMYSPQNLWRNESGSFLGRREGKKLVLIYDFFGASGENGNYTDCPTRRGDPERAPNCEDIQDAVMASLDLWAEASGYLILRRRVSSSEPVNIWIAWTDGFNEPHPPIARSVDNSRDARAPQRNDADESFRGFGRVAYPGAKKTLGALLFNDRYCWFLDEAACPAPTRAPNGKVLSNNRSVRLVSLHEAGHVLGFGHFQVNSIMGMAGGSERYELTEYDREAVRRLYQRVDASVPIQ